MARFHEGGVDTFNALVYTDPHPNTVRFLESMVNQSTHALSAASQQFMDAAKHSYDRFMGSDAMRRVRAAGRQIASIWQRNEIRPLVSIEELQTAPLKMQRWLMAEPTVRNLYHKQRCDGYSDTYVDSQPGKIGEDHYDYRRVMDGIIVETDDDGWTATEYVEDIDVNDREFMAEEQFDILRSWATMASTIFEGEQDPTSRWNAEL